MADPQQKRIEELEHEVERLRRSVKEDAILKHHAAFLQQDMADVEMANVTLQKDIFMKKQQVAEIREIMSLQETVLDSLPSGLAVLDDSMRILLANSVLRAVPEFPQAGIQNPPLPPFLAQHLPPEARCDGGWRKRALIGGSFRTIELKPLSRQGEARLWLLRVGEEVAAVEPSSGGQDMPGFDRDCLGLLAGGLAHDFNNVLAAIQGHADLMREFAPADSRMWHAAGKVIEITERSGKIIRRIMHHTRTAPPRTAPWPLAPFLEDLGTVFRMQLPEAMNLRISIRNRNLSLVQVPERMRMLLATLLDWGVQNAGTTGGQVEWLLEQDERGPLDHPSLRKQARTWAHLQITDNGPCLCDEERERFFEPFALATRYDERCGLGLSLVRHMLSRESGHIQVQSPVQDGRGVRFDVWLEAAPPVTRQLEGGEPNASDDQGNRPLSGDRPHHLLIVDDEPDLSRAIQLMLQRRGFTVSVRADSRSALELIMRDTGAISAVISDMNMPGMNGLELARTLADLPRRPAFILCTGLVPSEWPDPGHVDAVLVKPVSRQDYMDTLERLNIRPASGVKG